MGPASSLYKVSVASGKGVGIHDDSGASARLPSLCQLSKITGKPAEAILHEHRVLQPGHLIEAQIAQQPGALGLGVQEYPAVALSHLPFHQVGNDLVHEPLAPMI